MSGLELDGGWSVICDKNYQPERKCLFVKVVEGIPYLQLCDVVRIAHESDSMGPNYYNHKQPLWEDLHPDYRLSFQESIIEVPDLFTKMTTKRIFENTKLITLSGALQLIRTLPIGATEEHRERVCGFLSSYFSQADSQAASRVDSQAVSQVDSQVDSEAEPKVDSEAEPKVDSEAEPKVDSEAEPKDDEDDEADSKEDDEAEPKVEQLHVDELYVRLNLLRRAYMDYVEYSAGVVPDEIRTEFVTMLILNVRRAVG